MNFGVNLNETFEMRLLISTFLENGAGRPELTSLNAICNQVFYFAELHFSIIFQSEHIVYYYLM